MRGEFDLPVCWGSVVYAMSRRTVQLGYTQGVNERFPIQKLIRYSILQLHKPDCTVHCTYLYLTLIQYEYVPGGGN